MERCAFLGKRNSRDKGTKWPREREGGRSGNETTGSRSVPGKYPPKASVGVGDCDVLVKAIFAAVDLVGYTPEQKRVGMVRAGLIAQAYVFEADLLFSLNQDGDVNAGFGIGGESATAH